MKKIFLNIADIKILIKGVDFFGLLHPLERNIIRPFIQYKDNSPGFLANIKIINNNCIAGLRIFDPEVQKKLLVANDNNNKEIISNKRSLLIFDRQNRSCDVYYQKLRISKFSSYYKKWFYNLNILKLLWRIILNSKGNGIVIHASSIEYNGSGYIFIGPSGSGKTTVTKLLNPDRILSDDTTVIVHTKGAYHLFANPWWNSNPKVRISEPERPVPLKAIFTINKSGRTDMRKLDYKKSLMALIASDVSSPSIGFLSSTPVAKHFYLFSQELMSRIPIFEISVKKSKMFKEEFETLLSRYLS